MVDILRDMWDDGLVVRSMLALLILVGTLISLGIWAAVEEQKEWEVFAATHECKVVGHMSGSTQTGVGYGMTANRQFGTMVTTTSTPSKTGYLCNDGMTYWR